MKVLDAQGERKYVFRDFFELLPAAAAAVARYLAARTLRAATTPNATRIPSRRSFFIGDTLRASRHPRPRPERRTTNGGREG
jgi:hypothetical protein